MAQQYDDAPVELIGNVPGEQHQTQEWQKLRQADEPEIQHPSGDVIDLPADSHDDHLSGDRGKKSRAQIEGEIAILEHRQAVRGTLGLSADQSPSSLNDGCSSGRRPNGQR